MTIQIEKNAYDVFMKGNDGNARELIGYRAAVNGFRLVVAPVLFVGKELPTLIVAEETTGIKLHEFELTEDDMSRTHTVENVVDVLTEKLRNIEPMYIEDGIEFLQIELSMYEEVEAPIKRSDY